MNQMYADWMAIINRSPRPMGSVNAQLVYQYITSAIKQTGHSCQHHRFMYEKFEVSHFRGLANETSYVAVGSGSGVVDEGQLERRGTTNLWGMYEWPQYAVTSKGKVVGHITARPDGEALSQTLMHKSDLPHLFVGRDTHQRWEGAFDPVTVSFSVTTSYQNHEGVNVSTTIPAVEMEKHVVIFMAHYDSMYNTKGAYDNASGVSVLLELIRRIKPLKYTKLVFILFGAEELLLSGSKAYIHAYQDKYIKEKTNVINIDGIGRGTTVEIWSTDDDNHVEFFQETFEETGLKPVKRIPAPPGSDHAPFAEAGFKALMLTINDQEIIHTPKDEPTISMFDHMKEFVDVLERYIEENYE